MAYIYKITNQVNGKVYIGKTLLTVEKRWQEHKNAINKTQSKNRPLYQAMKKYGINNFIIEQIEECLPEEVNDKEQYYIAFYNSYIGWTNSNGYNATIGGDSRAYCDYPWVLQLWNEGKIIKEIVEITNYERSTISKILHNYNISKETIQKRSLEYKVKKQGRPVAQLDIETENIIQIFPSIAEAHRNFSVKPENGNIGSVCRGIRKTAYGFKWKYIE